MAANKTVTNDASVSEFINNIENAQRREDANKLVDIFRSATGFEPKMYGASIIGFGNYHYKYKTGREGDAPLAAFSPRKDSQVLYITADYNKPDPLLPKLGKFKTSKACIYIKKLDDIDTEVLSEMIKNCVAKVQQLYPEHYSETSTQTL